MLYRFDLKLFDIPATSFKLSDLVAEWLIRRQTAANLLQCSLRRLINSVVLKGKKLFFVSLSFSRFSVPVVCRWSTLIVLKDNRLIVVSAYCQLYPICLFSVFMRVDPYNNNIFRFLFIVPYKTLNSCLTGLSIQALSLIRDLSSIRDSFLSFDVANIC